MLPHIDTISINKDLFAACKKHVFFFRFAGMPDDVHFSISYHENSPDVNLHISRNTPGSKPKPKIEIARMNKQGIDSLVPYLTMDLFNVLLRPVKLQSSRRKTKRNHNGILYYPFPRPEDKEVYPVMEQAMLKHIKPLATISRSKLGIKGDIVHNLEQIMADPEFKFKDPILYGFQCLPRRVPKQNLAAFVIAKQFTGVVLSIHGQWYTFREDVKIVEMLSAWMDPALASLLIFKTLMAYARIKTLNSFEESKPYGNPIRLYKLL